MINPKSLLNSFINTKINFFAGVPDSLLKNFCNLLEQNTKIKHVIASNEGSAISLAIGSYLATKKVGVVYMQNSGLGNAINPLVSLADPLVYGIPIILIIGWRGEVLNGKQVKDEPQHKKQGLITLEMLKNLGIPYKILDKNSKKLNQKIKDLKKKSFQRGGPVALIVRKNTFASLHERSTKFNNNLVNREEIISLILDIISKNTKIISTTGMISRELYEQRIKKNQKHSNDFLCVGGMGHVSQIACGLSLEKKKLNIICLDGDGSLIMHMGALPINAKYSKIKHIVLNNKSHESVGGQPTIAEEIDLSLVGKASGYNNTLLIDNKKNIKKILIKELKKKTSSLIVINCNKGHRKNLGRPKDNILIRKKNFMKGII